MRGGIAAHVLTNKINSAKPPKHMFQIGTPCGRKMIDLDKFAKACEKRNVDLEDTLAQALSENNREEAGGLKGQAKILIDAWKASNAHKREVSGPDGGPIETSVKVIFGDS